MGKALLAQSRNDSSLLADSRTGRIRLKAGMPRPGTLHVGATPIGVASTRRRFYAPLN